MSAARPSPVRLPIVAVLALAAAYQVARSAAASNYVGTDPDLAARIWPAHPRVALAVAMGEIGTSAAASQAALPATVARAMEAARRGPLLVEPFLIEGAVALSKGDPVQAERMFREARRRDPRSAAARYFLAQLYLVSGRAREGLAEAAVLTRLVRGGSYALVPGLIRYAREPGAVPNLRRIFAANPELGDLVLVELARDASNAALVIDLAADGVDAGKGTAPPWQAALIRSLIERGDYAKAHALWRRVSGVRATQPALFNPNFARNDALAPFNWTLGSGAFGVAEPIESGGLQLIYYGRDNAQFAWQLLLLRPGSYELSMRVKRDSPNGDPSLLGWTVTCQPGTRQLLDLPIANADKGDGVLAGRFTVPANCPSQLLVLGGSAREFARTEQATISSLQLAGGAH